MFFSGGVLELTGRRTRTRRVRSLDTLCLKTNLVGKGQIPLNNAIEFDDYMDD